MTVSLVTWNINSVRFRIDLVERFLATFEPDILCLQETKCPDGSFPEQMFRKLGYNHIALNGQKAYHGVATISRIPFSNVDRMEFCGKGDTRHIATTFGADAHPALENVTLHNFYVPAGGDIPDFEKNEKFAHKRDFLGEMTDWSGKLPGNGGDKAILVGDLNIAPLETDVWSHKQLLKVVSHTPVEVDWLNRMQSAGKWVDVVRQHIPPEEKLYSWWSYRSPNWEVSDKGRRLDHIWASDTIAQRTQAISVLKEVRGWEKPSDHAPILATLV
ncbi:MAG: exodeoxyribonuclease III [Fimbriimonadaceae bacterium]|nr:exodeoxyribonuclease III [Alphaproteobacteria bacterium]